MADTKILNCSIYDRRDGLYEIAIRGERVLSIIKQPCFINIASGNEIDASGKTVIPGAIDVHIHGAGGSDMLDNSIEALETISKTLASVGTTGFLSTGISRPKMDNAHLRLIAGNAGRDFGGAQLLGIHLEGPFINFKKKGGLSPEGLYMPSRESLEAIFDAAGTSLKMMTIAPEVDGNIELIHELCSRGVIASFGHSAADYHETLKGFQAGINHVTHIFNAMQGLSHREPGPLAAIFETPNVTAQIISDGHHLHPVIVKMIYKLLGPERCICITDGISGIGMPEGIYTYAGKKYESKNGAARYVDDGGLIGSTMSLLNIAFNFMEFTGCPFETAINTVTKNPAKLLGIEGVSGSVEVGTQADLVLLNQDRSVCMTLVKGRIRYSE